jgi:predicted amidohydrolase
MKIALAQYEIKTGQPEKNLATLESIVKQAGEERSDLVLLPELCLHGYHSESLREKKMYHLPEILPTLVNLAKGSDIAICGTFVEDDGGSCYNTMVYINKAGQLLAKYRKTHLFRPLHEHHYFQPGNEPATVKTEFGVFGLAICYDLRFPELFRAMVQQGVTGFLISAEWPVERIEHWKTMVRSRAIENLAWVAACNCIGGTARVTFGGSSLFISPWGDVKAELAGETCQSVEFDPQLSSQIRQANPFLNDMRSF